MRHVISAVVINEPGVLANVAGMFAARGFNIDSLVVGRTEDPDLSRMTIVVNADDNTVEQVRKQLGKLVPVSSLHDFQGTAYVESDLMLLNVIAPPERRNEIISLVQVFEGKVTDVSPRTIMIEMTGSEEKLERFVELMRPFGIEELARTGVIAMSRGTQPSRGKAVHTKQTRERRLDAPAAAALPPS